MPLYAIPLCGFKYTRDNTLSSATFNYDTTDLVSKPQGKLLYKENSDSIDKNSKPYTMYDDMLLIDKTTSKPMYNEVSLMDKAESKPLYKNITLINIEQDEYLTREDILLSKSDDKGLISIYPNIVIMDSKPLSNIDDMGINKELEKELLIDQRELNKSIDKELGKVEPSEMYKAENKPLGSTIISEITQALNLSLLSLKVNALDIHHDLCMESNHSVEINEVNSIYCEYIRNKVMNRVDSSSYFDRIVQTNIYHKDELPSLTRITEKETFKNEVISYPLTRLTIKDIGTDKSKRLYYTSQVRQIFKYSYLDELVRVNIKNISKDDSKRVYYRWVLFKMMKDHTSNYLDDVTIIPVARLNYSRFFDRMTLVNTFKSYKDHFMTREILINTFRSQVKYCGNTPIINIFHNIEKLLKDLAIKPIYTDDYMLLKRYDHEMQRKNKTSFIEVTKRWWWLDSTNPKDRIIVPNRDYANMGDLLSNPNYEYLRYNNHPIDWGSSWGKDLSIPPMAVSVEILLDLVNILIMIWHKNVQGWLCCTGKEGIQLLMELLYDWYSMSTSNPSDGYYRAYRWIRWEAEKVYFLDTDSGLQSIGILIANLLDYLKLHHFNLVPLWPNPKAMDEERNFNRTATNDDLMPDDVDKNKGNRHYYIETQNFERKRLF